MEDLLKAIANLGFPIELLPICSSGLKAKWTALLLQYCYSFDVQ
jgi:hypothetical protein